ncbi:YceD family protein [Sulfuricystis multivorans]|uniref:YceD family protein n=1 Tax=Sulfuricystis multivorans TaxID=2211108 RepID=UPI000F837EF8|nr:YceD family protein [Sulfuricystis multivorans]
MIAFAPFMSCQEEPDFATAVIDSLRFAEEGGQIAGRLALAQLPRLADVVTSQEGWLACVLEGCRLDCAGESRPGLRLTVTGRVQLQCQRCLAAVEVDCAIDSHLLLVPSGADWPEEDLESDAWDAIEASPALSLLALVEEEVLLALPIVPRHADCVPPLAVGAAPEEDRAPSPFAVLAGLKQH